MRWSFVLPCMGSMQIAEGIETGFWMWYLGGILQLIGAGLRFIDIKRREVAEMDAIISDLKRLGKM